MIESLSSKANLTELCINQLNSFVMFEYQQKFSKHLRNFSSLKTLVIEYSDYEITQLFFDSLFELSDLVHLELMMKNLTANLFKQNIAKFQNVKSFFSFSLFLKNRLSMLFIFKDDKHRFSGYQMHRVFTECVKSKKRSKKSVSQRGFSFIRKMGPSRAAINC